ncbi:MAG TPA: O-antigen ligase family protein [Sphingobium sp.]|nr:O-antigen ligase family protein [Sphingobium sp.]
MQTDQYQPSRYAAPARRPSSIRPDAAQSWLDELHRWEFVLLQGAVFFAPYIAFRHPSVYITLSDVLFAGAFLLRLYTARLEAPFANLTWLWVLGLLMLTGGLFIGSVFKGDMVRCLILVAQYCFAYLIVPLVLLRRPDHEVWRLMKCGVWGMAIMCGIGLVLYLAGADQSSLFTGNKRYTGFVNNPNAAAVLSVMALPLVWFLLLSGRMRAVAAIPCIALLVVGIILTSSNTGLYSLAAAVLIFFGGRRNFKTLIGAACLGGAVLMFGQDYLPPAFQHRVLSAIEKGDVSEAGTFEGRQELNREALGMADENLIIGLGADQYRMASRYGNPVHNLYLLLLNEGGGLSLLGYLLILGVPILVAVIAYRLPDGKLGLWTTVTIVLTFANAIMGVPHVYGRSWFLFVFLAISPALISYASTRQASQPLYFDQGRGRYS